MSTSLLQWILLGAFAWLFFWTLRKIFIRSPLDNVPGPATEGFIYGNFRQILDRKDGWDFRDVLTNSHSGVAKLHGPLGTRILYVFDPKALHNVIVKDQTIFEESAWFLRTMGWLLGPGLLATLGAHHRKQRKMLNPVFSMAHMRRIVPIFNRVGHQLQDAIEKQVRAQSEPVEIDILMWMSRTALELIGQAGLGYSFDPLVADRPDAYAGAVKAFLPLFMENTLLFRVAPYVPERISAPLRKFTVAITPIAKLRRLKSVADVMHQRSVEIFMEKKRALEKGDAEVTRQVGEGNDLMSILLKANVAASEEDKLPEEELIGQMSTFTNAARDTTSSALSSTLELLAQHPDVQQKLRKEVLDAFAAKDGEDLDYDTLISLPYLDAVCRETLRLHPPIPEVFREARQDVVLPLSEPITGVDGTQIHEILVPKDTTIIVGIISSNRNKAIWGDDAGEWKPERWLSPLPQSVSDAKVPGIYSNLMTFIGGGRACIGFKFSQLEMKVVLALLLSKFTFDLSNKTIIWNFNAICFPGVQGANETKPAMPLRVGLYNAAESA